MLSNKVFLCVVADISSILNKLLHTTNAINTKELLSKAEDRNSQTTPTACGTNTGHSHTV